MKPLERSREGERAGRNKTKDIGVHDHDSSHGLDVGCYGGTEFNQSTA